MKKSESLLILLGIFLLSFIIACGGGDSESSETATGDSHSSDHSQAAKSASSHYPNNPAEVVKAFLTESQQGNISNAFSTYVDGGSMLYGELVSNGDIGEFRKSLRLYDIEVSGTEMTSTDEASVTIKYTGVDEEGEEDLKVRKIDGKWKIDKNMFN